MSKPDKPTFVLTLTPKGPCQRDEGYRRLKAALKGLLRSYGLRCTSVVTNGSKITADSIEREGDR